MKRPPPHNWLFVFKIIVESGSITEASERLNVSQSAVSQQIKSLEDYLDTRLIVRGKKGISLTDVGKHYYNVIKIALDKISDTTDQLFGSGRADTVTIKSNYSFADTWISGKLHEFHKLYPGTRVELYSGLWLTDFGEIGRGIEIRYGDGAWGDSSCHQLTRDNVFPVCSPATRNSITKRADMFEHPLISVMGNKIGWQEWCDAQQLSLDVKPSSLYVESNLLAYKAARSGNYICLGINSLVDAFIQDGSLVKLEFGEIKSRENFFIVEPDYYSISPKEMLFAEWIKSAFK
ncbi:LysR family transcriptional regulator [Pseudomonas sp. LPB0260]|uniref:LysR family transcriptional regulator n=1 Tax=Pseudomonas sp. LPB0260 TaxID=2614442 RepID=UPI0015C21806|nr:LysR family transcriptional regulator [Pseudomonas sp. LPB0260]QLC74129.1 LysR family transcriptional regulator [Pseudomonas sp. LPB0260]QLC76900.1 LysR family transcriptional regulator [Pseudomonas sp. LPB0260]